MAPQILSVMYWYAVSSTGPLGHAPAASGRIIAAPSASASAMKAPIAVPVPL